MKILITGAAGFIGFHLVRELVQSQGMQITGIDNINDYYSVDLKYDRLEECGIHRESVQSSCPADSERYPDYRFAKIDITDYEALNALFQESGFQVVIHLAAQAGVRYSIDNPHAYIQSNICGFTNILECCRHHHVKHLIYASSSSVYGMNRQIPFSEDANVDYPISLYAATKKSNELLAHTYSHLFHLPTTGLRFFTVYGPWGRPDMAPMLFSHAISKGEAINVFNNGDMQRDFTYVGDIVKVIPRLIEKAPDDTTDHPYYRICNIGHSEPVNLLDFLKTLEKALGKQARFNFLPMQPGDVPVTYADTTRLDTLIGYKPQTSVEEGISLFVEWFREYYK